MEEACTRRLAKFCEVGTSEI